MLPLPANPFPGLRPFRQGEEALFFGRETQVDAMVDRLAATRLLVVVGTSGSGKSSLVNCGLVPALHRGLMDQAGSAWRVAVLRPGNRPLRALAEALAAPGLLSPGPVIASNAGTAHTPPDDGSDFTPTELMEALLRMSKLGLVDAFEQARLAPRQNLLVVVDQFEELFRFSALAAGGAQAGKGNEDATAFVNLLLQAAHHENLPVYVVLTMRSDFLGDCAQFEGLPEAINRGQYLVPRMSRDERRAAIAGPVGVSGAQIDPVLLTRLVNDVGDDPDQLSLLQHALNRTWAAWHESDHHGGRTGPLTLTHYESIGTMAQALDKHAEEAFAALSGPMEQALCGQLFKAITDRGTDSRGTRRPTRMDTLVAITGGSADELAAVIDVFREPTRSFLMPPAGTPLAPDTPVDISHESLMRVWQRLRDWVDQEARSAQTWRRLAETAELQAVGRAALLRPPDLPFTLDWQAREQPTAAWAHRYRPGLDAALAFLKRSQQAYDDEVRSEQAETAERAQLLRQGKRFRLLLLVAAVASTVLVVMFSAMGWLYSQADRERDIATEERARSKLAERDARAAQDKAESALLAMRRAVDSQGWQQQAYSNALTGKVELQQEIKRAVQDKRAVYVQYADPDQRSAVDALRPHLRGAGWLAPRSERVQSSPGTAQIRYFRDTDAEQARSLSGLFKRWGWGVVRPEFVKSNEGTWPISQFEVWLARPNPAELARLLKAIDSPVKDERTKALQTLVDTQGASPAAIGAALAMASASSIEFVSAPGRFNLLYFLSRTAPLAWDETRINSAREILARVRNRSEVGRDTLEEFARLERLLAAAAAGEAFGPPV